MFQKIVVAITFFVLSIQVAHSAPFRLNWVPPTTNVDGSPLTDLSGYKVYYGVSPGVYDTVSTITNIRNHVINKPVNTTWYFAVTAYDLDGLESAFSNEVSKNKAGSSTLISSKVSRTAGTIVSDPINITYNTADFYNVIIDIDTADMTISSTDITILVEKYVSNAWVVDSRARYKSVPVSKAKFPVLLVGWKKLTATTQVRVSVTTTTTLTFGITLESF